MKHLAGFTLVELVMTIIIVGILAVFAVPRFFDAGIFRSHGAANQVKAALRYGQKVAIAQHNPVTVNITAAPNPICDTTVTAYVVSCQIPTDVTISQTLPSAVTFDALGRPYSPYSPIPIPLAPPNNTITIGGTVITIEAETGYVH